MALGTKLLHLLYIFLFNTFKEGLHLSSLTKLYLDEEEDSAQEAKQLSSFSRVKSKTYFVRIRRFMNDDDDEDDDGI